MSFPFVAFKMNTVLIATTNPGKQKEFKNLFNGTNMPIVFPQDQNKKIKPVKETGTTFSQNALIKAKAFAQKTNLITLADDTGLSVDILDGKPGVYSARFAPTDQQRNARLLKLLKNVPFLKRTANFVSVICIYNPQTNTHKFIQGKIQGLIALKPQGKRGFGYDPIFYIPRLKKTFAQISLKQKNQISHRSIAIKKAIKYLQNTL